MKPEKVKIKLLVNDPYLIAEYGIYRGVRLNAEKVVSMSKGQPTDQCKYYVVLIHLDSCPHNHAGKPQRVMIKQDEAKELLSAVPKRPPQSKPT